MRKLTGKVVVGLVVISLLIICMGNLVEAAITTYTVQPGDSLWKIGKKFNTSVSYLKQLNNLWSNTIYVGQKLKVPATIASVGWVYTVKWGDSLWKIAQKTGTSVDAIKKANNLYSNNIWVGQKLTIPTNPTNSSTTNVSNISQSDLDLLARVIYAEAQGEPFEGQVAVGAVVLNRVKSPYFPNTIKGVVFQKYAFESVSNGEIWRNQPNATAYQAARAALSGQDPTGGALYFFNPAKINNPYSWIWTRKVTKIIGNHSFAI
ncbi:hypothetical protein BBF96_05200 [Anoxybacter fermentans]|uniref:LysM domain-containing protein n=1 Tax=Anoxybacter fermentans TaxID=1323375 RepID=A0A3S9SX14_9FIRM|nr:LysM peptidoglycan-binding domain-containing protein [Anoxybacter fermentans]AZR72839.1 hypothetical protein BBF96_05200 [Anoxybacter fermentans]